MTEIRRGPLPEDEGIPQSDIDSAPQVQEADQIISKADARFGQSEVPDAVLTPEEREALRTFSVDQVPNIISNSLERVQEIQRGLREEVKQHPKDPTLTEKLKLANECADTIANAQQIITEHRDSASNTDLINLAHAVLTKKEKLEDLWHPAEPPERWPGSNVHDISDDEAEPGAYEAAIAAADQAQGSPESEDAFSLEEYQALISDTADRIYRLDFNTTDERASAISRVEGVRAEAMRLMSGWRKMNSTPHMSPERIEMEERHLHIQLRELLTTLEHIEESLG